jgi:hypothetical protein
LNPITENRYRLVRYVVLWGLFAAVYAVAFGLAAALPASVAALDGAVFGTVAGLEGLILWNVLKYGTDGIGMPFMRLIYRTAVGALFIAVAVGASVAAVWLSMEQLPTEFAATIPTGFAATIPTRVLVTAVVYVCFALWYSSVSRSEVGTRADGPETKSANETPEKSEASEVTEPLERITVRGAGGRIELITLGEIIYLQAEGDYVAIVTTGGRWLKEGTMKYFEEVLPRSRFVRVHRSYIVAVGHISRIETSGRDHTLVLRGASDARNGSANGGGKNVMNPGTIRISEAGYRLLKRTLGL